MVSIPTLGKYEAHFNRRFCCMNCWQTRRGLAFSETAESRDKPVTIIQSMLRRRLMYTFVFDPKLNVKKGPHPRASPALHLGASWSVFRDVVQAVCVQEQRCCSWMRTHETCVAQEGASQHGLQFAEQQMERCSDPDCTQLRAVGQLHHHDVLLMTFC